MAANTSPLPPPALAASRAALNAAFADQQSAEPVDADAENTTSEPIIDDSLTLEPGEIQEVDMQAQAEGIRTVFSDPTNFNVKVCYHFSYSRRD
jgi:translation initiation factor 4E